MSEYRFLANGETITAQAHRVRQGEWKISVNGKEYHILDGKKNGARLSFCWNDKVVSGFVVAEKNERIVGLRHEQYSLQTISSDRDRSKEHGTHGEIDSHVRAPMPGKVIKLSCAIGDTVSAKTSLVVLEAMKMEFVLAAPRDGEVAEVKCKVGDQVELGDVLVALVEEQIPIEVSE